MKYKRSLLLFIIFLTNLSSNTNASTPIENKGKLYFYWGWNRDSYSKTSIHFTGDHYDFTLKNVIAKDRQSPFNMHTYFSPGSATIPQYNFRLGYFLRNHYNISFGIDHMKYVVKALQTVKISGTISETGTQYDKTYSNDDIALNYDFLKFEHTDGLNYINIEFRRVDEFYSYKKMQLNLTEGLGAGGLYPRSDVTLMNNLRNDEFHWAGYGISAIVGLNLTFYKHYFIQSEFKGGYINLPDVRTTISKSDKASQHFFFTQLNIVFGASFNLIKSKK